VGRHRGERGKSRKHAVIRLKHFIGGLLVMATVFVISLALWLTAPWDRESWRIQPPGLFAGLPTIRANALLQLATILPDYLPANTVNVPSRFGTLAFTNNPHGFQLSCSPCRALLPAISRQPLTVSYMTLTMQGTESHFSGKLIADGVSVNYETKIDKNVVHVRWQLPSTRLEKLIKPLHSVSAVVSRAKVGGLMQASGTINLAQASGTIDLPILTWSVKPEISGFSVSGLGTSALKTAEIRYRCPSKPLAGKPLPYVWLQPKAMGRWLPRAVIIAEDAQFKNHRGFDLQAIQLILAKGERIQKLGGSTITQQLAKNFFTGGERTGLRKLEELLYAVEMENTLGKQLIFGLYLNTVEWGPGICGAAQAAKAYFQREPKQLNPSQAAWLSGILKNPHQAWLRQFLTDKPDLDKAKWVLGFMPKSAKTRNATVAFAR
jgi:monofunctional glycosyltransferase